MRSFIPLLVVLLMLFSLPLADKLYFGRKRRRFEKDCNAMHWKLDAVNEDIVFSEFNFI